MENIEVLDLLVLGSIKCTSLIVPGLMKAYKKQANTRKHALIPKVKILINVNQN